MGVGARLLPFGRVDLHLARPVSRRLRYPSDLQSPPGFAQQEQAELNVERLEYFADVDVRTVIVDPQGNPIEDAETGEPILPDPLRLPSIPDPVDPSDSGPADPDDPLPAAAPSDERFSMVIEPEPSRGTAFCHHSRSGASAARGRMERRRGCRAAAAAKRRRPHALDTTTRTAR